MVNDNVTQGQLPHLHWGAVAVGALCALAIHLVLGLFSSAFGFAAVPADSNALGIIAVVWSLLVPFIALSIGALISVRILGAVERKSAFLHGAVVWSMVVIGATLIAGPLLRSLVAGAAPEATRAAISRTGDRDNRSNEKRAADETARDNASKAAAAASGLAALAALIGLGGALLGAEIGRRELTGEPMFRGKKSPRRKLDDKLPARFEAPPPSRSAPPPYDPRNPIGH